MDRPNPRNLTREQLASFIPRVDVQRAVESFFKYLAESLPDAVDSNTELIESAQESADNAAAVSAVAQAIAITALDMAQHMAEGPPVTVYPAQEPDDNTHLIRSLEAQIDALHKRIAALEETP